MGENLIVKETMFNHLERDHRMVISLGQRILTMNHAMPTSTADVVPLLVYC